MLNRQPATRQTHLLVIADRISTLDADIGAEAAQATFVATIDALTHSLVDLADGRTSQRASVPIAAHGIVAAADDRVAEADRASCAAAAVELRRVRYRLPAVLGHGAELEPGLATNTLRAAALLAEALQELADLSPGDPRSRTVRATAHRAIASAHRLLLSPTTLASEPDVRTTTSEG